jgi:hypothetical protein
MGTGTVGDVDFGLDVRQESHPADRLRLKLIGSADARIMSAGKFRQISFIEPCASSHINFA